MHLVNDPVQSILRAFVICISFWKVFYFFTKYPVRFFKGDYSRQRNQYLGGLRNPNGIVDFKIDDDQKSINCIFYDRLLRSIIATKRLFKMNFLLACFKALPKFGAKIIARMLPIYREIKVVSSQAKTGRAWSECKFR